MIMGESDGWLWVRVMSDYYEGFGRIRVGYERRFLYWRGGERGSECH